MIEPEPVAADWYEQHEAEYVERAISMIRVFQFKCPDAVGPYRDPSAPWTGSWWRDFWRMLEGQAVVEQRQLFERVWRERNQPGGRQTDLESFANRDPRYCPYIRHGQQDLSDYTEEGSA